MTSSVNTTAAISTLGGGSSVNFPTSVGAFARVTTNLVAEFGQITNQTSASAPSGSSNAVTIYTIDFDNGEKKKIAVRTEKIPSFKKAEMGGGWLGYIPLAASFFETGAHTTLQPPPHGSFTLTPTASTFAEVKDEASKSEVNWIQAHSLNLSPKLYFYGYIVPATSSNNLYLCVISDAFDSDLHAFYRTTLPGLGLTLAQSKKVNDNVRSQLTELFNQMASKMHMICFDIKPGNTVIKYDSPDVLTVKLIDWDANFCKKFAYLKKKGGIAKQTLGPFTSVVMQVIMAMFFYLYYDNNIFADFFNDNTTMVGDILTEHNGSLKALFCTENRDFQLMAKHYFRGGTMSIPTTCEELWDEMYKRVFYKNAAAFDAAVVASTTGGGGVVVHNPGGGGRRRRKKRQKRRNSKRRRRTQRKRRNIRKKTRRRKRKRTKKRKRTRKH